ncbi:MAG: glycosyltransferase family 2 protein [Chitinispirillales bacterium]|jgi:hypothetical protein|nr:glycosyltransferase family 2 protein [Chitinispirillales bacterium]
MNLKRIIVFFKKLPPNSLKYYLKRIAFSFGFTKNAKLAAKLYKENNEFLKDCRTAFFDMAFDGRNMVEYVNSYKNKTVMPVRVLNIPLNENDAIFLCVVKNDLIRVKAQIDYHRKIGIKHFAYIDNMSTDGTFEWLENQNDVSLFRASEEYRSDRQRSWMRQATDVFGYDKWYLDMDSDELFSYPGIESKPIDKYIDFLEKNEIHTVFTLVVDMYSKCSLFNSSSCDDNNFLEKYCYFDTSTYKIQKKKTCPLLGGGPRMRLFTIKRHRLNLTNYSLVKLSKSTIIGAHNNYPFKLNFDTPAPIAFLLHYKFLPSDNLKFKEHVKSGVHARGSIEYKRYMEVFDENPNASFYYEDSQKLNDSMDLLRINIVDKRFFNKFLYQ